MRSLPLLTSAALSAFVTTHAAFALDLRLADTLPPSHVYREVMTRPFIQDIERRTNGEVKIADFPAGQLGQQRDYLTLTQTGATDIGYIVPAALSAKLPLSTVAELPGIIAHSCEGALTMWSLARPGGILYEQEYAPNGIRPLALIVAEPYQVLFNTKRPVQSIKDLNGLKIRSTGAALQQYVKNLGGVPVNVATPEVREAMSRGTIDAAILGFQAVAGYDLGPLLQTVTIGERFGSSYIVYVMSEERWQKLPASVRSAIDAAGEQVTKDACGKLTAAEKVFGEKLRERGVKIVSFSAAERAQLREAAGSTLQQWATELDKRGRPGTRVLQAFESRRKKLFP